MVVGDWLQVMLAYFVWFADGKGWQDGLVEHFAKKI